MESFELKALDVFNEIVINKNFVHQAGFGSRSIPTYVREWIISNYLDNAAELTEFSKKKIARFVDKFVPIKSQKETIKNDLFNQQEVQFLDNFSVYVNLEKGDRYLNIPFLDMSQAYLTPQIIQDNDMLLSSGLWGVGSLYYIPRTEESERGQVWMREFQPFQLANLDLEYFTESRKNFSTLEWIDFLVSSMGFNHKLYSDRQKVLLICRLLPMVEPRYNLVELAPKGTGKSFVFDNMSRYVAVRSGAITPAVLFFNDARKTPGLITRYDCVVIDEAQKVKADSSGELTALLKSYLEAGVFARGSAGAIAAEAGLVMLANIDLDRNKRPLNNEVGLFRIFPNFLRETAFIDRFSGLLPGWDLPRVSKDTPSKSVGLKGDIFGEILHSLRGDITYRDYVKTNMELKKCDDMRDSKAVEAGAAALLKVIFPDKNPSEEDFYQYCANPALELRQRVKDELCKMDREYTSVSFSSKYPDDFQRNHRHVDYREPDANTFFPDLPLEQELITASDVEEAKVLQYYGVIDEPAIEEELEAEVQSGEEKREELTPEIEGEAEQLVSKTIRIREGQMGHSYQSLFGPYLRGATKIYLTDPYVRLEYQIRNLMEFINIIDTSDKEVEVNLITTAEDEYEAISLEVKYNEIRASAAQHGVVFKYEFTPTVHDRSIKLDNGWNIYMGRGLDIFQKPDSWYDFSEFDQKKRKCRETNIIFQSI